jgi:hypothetical protein
LAVAKASRVLVEVAFPALADLVEEAEATPWEVEIHLAVAEIHSVAAAKAFEVWEEEASEVVAKGAAIREVAIKVAATG